MLFRSHPPKTQRQLGRIITAFLDKFAIEDAIEDELDIPGWTQQTVDEMTKRYEQDLYEIGRIPGVNFIAP